MPVVHQTKREFVNETLAKHGFGRKKKTSGLKPAKDNDKKPEVSLLVETHLRFVDQGRKNVLRLLQLQQ